MKKLVLLLPVAVFVLIAALFGLQPGREAKAVEAFESDRAVLEELAQRAVTQGTEGLEVSPPWRAIEIHDSGLLTVEFSLGAGGFASETQYWGIHYVPDDEPVGYRGQFWDYWKQDGDGRMYYEPEGDNTCYVKKLDDCWYYYEMSY